MRLSGHGSRGSSVDITGELSARLAMKATNYDVELEYILRRWIATLLPNHSEALLNPGPPLPGPMGNAPWAAFFQTLSDGVILCELANRVATSPDQKIKIELNTGKRLHKFRNISAFIAFSSKIGLPTFTMDALLEGVDPSAVQLNLHRLYLLETRRAKKAKKLSREASMASRQSSRNASTASLTHLSQNQGPSVSTNVAAQGSTQPGHLRTPISTMEPTNQFSSEMEYEKLLKEIDSILFVPAANATLSPKASQAQLETLLIPERRQSVPSIGTSNNPMDPRSLNSDGQRVPPHNTAEASAQFLQQLEDHNALVSPNMDPTWAVPEHEEKEMVRWVNSKLVEQVPSPVGVAHCLGEDGEPQSKRTMQVQNVGKDFRTGVALLQLLQALGTNVGQYERDVTSLYDCAANVSLAIRGLSAATFCPNFRPLEIVKGNAAATMEVLKYIREKFDFSYFYDRLLEHNQVTKMLLPFTPPGPQMLPMDNSDTVSVATTDDEIGSQVDDSGIMPPPRSASRRVTSPVPSEGELSDEELPIGRLRIGSSSENLLATETFVKSPVDNIKSPILLPPGVIPPRNDSLATQAKAPKAAAVAAPSVPAIVTVPVVASAMEISIAHATMRKHIVRELVSSEQKYCDNLRLLCEEYADRVEALPALGVEDKIALTGRVQDILAQHRDLLDDLEDELSQWNDTSAISGIFRKRLPSLECYRIYMKCYSRIGLHIAYKQKFQPAMSTITQQFNARVASQGGLWLDSYLLMPIQRLPRIVLMLRDMLKHTPPTWTDSQELAVVIEQLEALLKSINAEIPQQQTVSLKEMQVLISNYDGSSDCMKCLTPDSNMVAIAALGSYKINRNGKSQTSDDADLHRVFATTSGLLVTTQKIEAQRKKMMGRNKSGTIVPDGARKIEIPWYASWKDCSLALQGSTITAISSVEGAGQCKIVFDDADEASKLFKQLKAAN